MRTKHSSDLKGGVMLFQAVTMFFEEMGWPFEVVEGQEGVLQTGYEGANGVFVCFCHCREDAQQIIFYVVAEERCPEPYLQAMAEFLTRANFGMLIGNFELDYSDGEVRYKTSLDLEDAGMSPALLRNLVVAASTTFDRYYTGFQSVASGALGAIEAIVQVETHVVQGEA
jgi:hypothetical protein